MRLLIVGGSDAGIAAALRARELDPAADVTVVLADQYPNYSICGIPYHVSGEVPDARRLAHRSLADLEATGMQVRLNSVVTAIDTGSRHVTVRRDGRDEHLAHDRLIVATGAVPQRPPIDGLDAVGPGHGLHLLHTMGDTANVMTTLTGRHPRSAAIVGAGYIGLEMAEALTGRGLQVTVIEQLPQVLSTVDPELGDDIAAELRRHGVRVHTGTPIRSVAAHDDELVLYGEDGFSVRAGLVLVVTGVRPDTELAQKAGIAVADPHGAIAVDRHMRTNVEDVYAAGDCVVTHHRLLGESYLPLGTTAHKQGRVAGENAVGGDRRFGGSLGTQVVRVFDLVATRTGLRHTEAVDAGFEPLTTDTTADDHKAYYPHAQPVRVRLTADRGSRRLLGVQMLGAVPTGVAKRIDTAASALYAELMVDDLIDLDLSYTPPLGTPWDVLQNAAIDWQSAISSGG